MFDRGTRHGKYSTRNPLRATWTIDSYIANIQQHIQSVDDRIKYAGFIEGFQTTFATFYGQHDRYSDAVKLFNEALDCPWGYRQVKLLDTVKLRTMSNVCVVYLYTKELTQARDML